MIGAHVTDERIVTNATGHETVELLVGWVLQEPHWCGSSSQQISRCAAEIILDTVPLSARYSRSMFNIFDNANIYTSAECGFAVVSEIVIGFIYGGLAGVMSSLMMSGGASQQAYMEQMMALKAWMKSKRMPKRHRAKILAHFETQLEEGSMFSEREILSQLPPTLSSDISYHLYHGVLSAVPIFKGMGQELMTKMCMIVTPMKALKDQVIYEEGLVGSSMYLILEGCGGRCVVLLAGRFG
jgi:hypothetical protein